MKKIWILVLAAAVIFAIFFSLPVKGEARGGHGGPPIGPCLFAGFGLLAGAAVSQALAPPVVVTPSQCYEVIPVWGPPRWDGQTYIRDRVGERRVQVPCLERR